MKSLKGMASTAFYMVAGTAALGVSAWHMATYFAHDGTHPAPANKSVIQPPTDTDDDYTGHGTPMQYLVVSHGQTGRKTRKAQAAFAAMAGATTASGTAVYGFVSPLHDVVTEAPLSVWRHKKTDRHEPPQFHPDAAAGPHAAPAPADIKKSNIINVL
jgi:hypothetical protein